MNHRAFIRFGLFTTTISLVAATHSFQPRLRNAQPTTTTRVQQQQQQQQPPQHKNILRVEFDPGKSSILGQGTFGTVRKAVETTTGRGVALKVVRRNAKSLTHEIEALKRIREHGGHPNVVSLLGVVTIDGDPNKYGLVFELLEGGELYESLVKNGAYSESQASSVIRQVSSALAFLHDECRIAHADLKPENLLLRNSVDFQTAICDFGSAVELDEDGSFKLSPNRLLGTVAYAAPELLSSFKTSNALLNSLPRMSEERASSAVDVWSLGCILYVVLSGVHPFDPDNELNTDEELAKSILKGEFDFEGPAWKFVSDSAKDLIRRMLEFRPEKRITAQQILKHDWICLPQPKTIISGSDVRLMGFLRTQKRLQDHVFHLMLDGSLKSGRSRVGSSRTSAEEESRSNAVDEESQDSTETALNGFYRKVDIEGKGFITKKDLERTLLTKDPVVNADPSTSDEDDDKLYYSSLNGLVGCGERVVFGPGEVVFEKGDPAYAFYFVDRGKVEVNIGKENAPSLYIGAGDFFGETALIKNQPRNATIRAGPKGAELIRFSRDDFDRLVLGSDTFKMLDEHVKKRTVEHIKYVFSTMFDDSRTVHLGYGGILLKRGELSDSMYYIVDGCVDVITSSGQVVAQRKEGETVGELGLVTGEPRSMDIVCSSPNGCAFKRLVKEDLERLLQFSPLAHAELTNALSTRSRTPTSSAGSDNSSTTVVNDNKNEHQSLVSTIQRRWTLIQGSAKEKKPSVEEKKGNDKTKLNERKQ